MTSEPANPPPERRRLGPVAVLWRAAAIALVVIVMVAVAHYLRSPARFQAEAEMAASAGVPGERPAVPPAGPSAAAPGSTEATAGLRRIMAGLLMSASDEDGEYDDVRNKDPEERRRFIARTFGLPQGYPGSAAPADLTPTGAEVLMVFEDPMSPNVRMVLVRIRKGVDAALEDFCKLYAAAGWEIREPVDPKAQTDRGWLVRFTRRDQHRIVYARARQSGEETLAAIYDPRY
jgi:hypothetical protein